MVDPRIYRSGLALVAVAVIAFAFSLSDQPVASPTNLAPSAVSGKAPYATMLALAQRFPHRPPGSVGDRRLAGYVAARLRSANGFTVTTSTANARTSQGSVPLTTVTATRTGLTRGAIVVVSHRDAAGTADLSGTAVMLDLARMVSGETESHTLMLVSTSGSIGAAGATRVARNLAGQAIDAVVVLGDLASAHPSRPVVVPWSNSERVAPTLLRRTMSKYVTADTGIPTSDPSLPSQFVHLAFPASITEQGPFGRYGLPSVLLSLSGYRNPVGNEQVSPVHIGESENALLQTLNALDTGRRAGAPTPYLLLSGKVVPGWAVRLLVLALMLPVGLATVDALARARRRGHSLLRWLAWVVASAVPFALAAVVLLIVRIGGLFPASPPGPVAGGVPLGAGGIALLIVLALVLVGGFAALRPRCVRWAAGLGGVRRHPSGPAGDAAAVALMGVVGLTTLIIWVGNPFAAALLIPALHLWLWLAQPSVRSRRGLMVCLALGGLVAPLLVAVYYIHSFDLSAVGFAWSAVLLVVGGQLSAIATLGLCLLAGCAVSALVIAARASATVPAAPDKVTVRGPATYAGPGSLGGTESALSSRR